MLRFLLVTILMKNLLTTSLGEGLNISIITEYKKNRSILINETLNDSFGANLTLEGDEIPANECLMQAKFKEVDDAYENPTKFLPSKNFASVIKEIEQSEVFKIIQKMPKGANFHAHSTAMTSLNFIVKEMIEVPNLYACSDNKYKWRFRFFQLAPKKPIHNCKKWQDLRFLPKNNTLTSEGIKNHLMKLSNSFKEDLDLDDMWNNFEELFQTLKGILTYRPNFERYFYQALQELYDDNIMYVEVRSSCSKVYELNGTVYKPVQVLAIYKRVIDQFKKDHPDFLGVKIIYSAQRSSSSETFQNHVKTFRELKKAYPDLIVGFDLVGQEDKGESLMNFLETLLELGKETNFFFHAGETNWFGHKADENLYDAVLLNTKRIGHGYALLKHPRLMEMVKAKNITIELNPISNQILKLVSDLRNHPASYFFAKNFPITVSNDDPSLWGARGLSYDFYEAFVGIMSRRADLRALKQLATNSIVFSTMNDQERETAFEVWGKAWNKFVKGLSKECDTSKNTVDL